jgi:hypothetical protein
VSGPSGASVTAPNPFERCDDLCDGRRSRELRNLRLHAAGARTPTSSAIFAWSWAVDPSGLTDAVPDASQLTTDRLDAPALWSAAGLPFIRMPA